MSRAVIIELLLAWLGPVLMELLKSLFDRAAVRMAAGPASYGAETGVALLFDTAADELAWYQFRKRAVLKVCRKMALARAKEFWMEARGEADVRGITPMRGSEVKELANALA